MNMKRHTSELNPGTPHLDAQAAYWAEWNRENRLGKTTALSEREAQWVLHGISQIPQRPLRILEVGCGTGWMCERLRPFGIVTGLDLSESMLQEARQRVPDVQFLANSIFSCEFPLGSFDVIVTMEVIAHVANQAAFISKCAGLLKPGGSLLLTVQNRPIYERMAEVAPASPRQIRRWLNSRELRYLACQLLHVRELKSIEPRGHKGFLRYTNSTRVNALVASLFSETQVRRWKEALGLGCTLVMHAEKPRARLLELSGSDADVARACIRWTDNPFFLTASEDQLNT